MSQVKMYCCNICFNTHFTHPKMPAGKFKYACIPQCAESETILADFCMICISLIRYLGHSYVSTIMRKVQNVCEEFSK